MHRNYFNGFSFEDHKCFRKGAHFRELRPCMNSWGQNEMTPKLSSLILPHLYTTKWWQGGYVPSQPLAFDHSSCGFTYISPDMRVEYFYGMTHIFKFANLAITYLRFHLKFWLCVDLL